MKKIKLLFKTLNFLGSNAGTTLRSTLAHTLRVDQSETVYRQENMQKWDCTQTAANQLWIGNSFLAQGQNLAPNTMLDFSTFMTFGMNTEFINSIVSHYQQPANKGRLNEQIASAKFALRTAFKAIEKNVPDNVSSMVSRCLKDGSNYDELKDIFVDLPQEFRPKQLVQKLERFYSRQKRKGRYPCRKSTIVQEGILTFPLRDPLTVGFAELENELTSSDLIFAVKSFLDKYFSEYPIIAIVAHVDEVRLHVHYFIDGWSNGQLPKTIPQKVFSCFLPFDLLAKSNNSVLSKEDLKKVGSTLQVCFFEHINEVLLNKKGIHAEISPIEERNSAEAKHRNLDAKKPIYMRKYQRINEQVRQLELQQEALNVRNAELQRTLAKLVQKDIELKEAIAENDDTILEQQKIVDVLHGEGYWEFTDALTAAFKLAPLFTFTTDLEAKINVLLKRYPLLQRDFWQDLLRLGLGANGAVYSDNKKANNSN
ncbi:hypothetical protein VT06_16080 [Arsukibacterium sp. MJ3]|uniref:hypothetical protein n=1 Tax=Arsukibacterium sp. MJ3 TaxID=1632859 RepID=UPI0006270A82|nr:hypothetical protein [Arsukibacterium sp. MJ3]KKO47607.1 hypothetical protein VT06_16080 [Arsukibacterium sp. MJ3]